MKYLLPCSCGKSIAVDVAQAGQRVACACGQSIEAPTLRALKALPPLADHNATEAHLRSAPTWTSTQGSLFAIGVVVALIGLAAAGYCLYALNEIDVPPPTPDVLAEADKQFDRIPVDRMFDIYNAVRKQGLGTPEPPMYVLAQRAEARYTRYLLIAGSVGGAGLLMAIGAFFIKGK